MSMEFERQLLPVDSFPPNLQMHVKADAPPKMKMMAARGMVPAPPAQLVQVLFQLHFDASVSEAVTSALADMPENVLVSALNKGQPPGVLDWVAEVREDGAVQEAIVLSKEAHDATICRLAETAEADVCEIIANNQVRVLRSPAIIEALYKNTKARMSTVDKLIDLAQRNEVDFSGLPGLNQALRGGGLKDDGTGLDDEAFSKLLGKEGEKAGNEEARLKKLEDSNLTRSERAALEAEMAAEGDFGEDDDEEAQEKKRGSNLYKEIAEMNIAQKVRLATVGSREAIKILIRDSNKLIHMAAVQSPRMQVGDIRRMSANKSLPEGVVKYIASNRDWTRHYDIMVNLTMNPKTPLSDVMSFMNHLRIRELRQLSRNRNVSQQVARMAKQLMKKRGNR